MNNKEKHFLRITCITLTALLLIIAILFFNGKRVYENITPDQRAIGLFDLAAESSLALEVDYFEDTKHTPYTTVHIDDNYFVKVFIVDDLQGAGGIATNRVDLNFETDELFNYGVIAILDGLDEADYLTVVTHEVVHIVDRYFILFHPEEDPYSGFMMEKRAYMTGYLVEKIMNYQ